METPSSNSSTPQLRPSGSPATKAFLSCAPPKEPRHSWSRGEEEEVTGIWNSNHYDMLAVVAKVNK